MKFKSLLLAAAVTAASFSGVANAAIDGPTSSGASVDSDLVFYIYDSANDLSYLQNLDINYKDIILPTAGAFSGSFNLDAAKLNIFASSNSANLVWGMAATGLDFNDADGSTLGFVGTRLFPAVPQELDAIGEMNLKFNNLAVEVNLFTEIGTANALTATGAAASKLSNAVKAFAAYEQAKNVSIAQDLLFYHTDADYAATPHQLASANAWVLNLSNVSTATLSSAPVSAVPLPAAAWLMFSALLGLGGIARRRNAKV